MTENLVTNWNKSAVESPVNSSASSMNEDAKPHSWTSSMALTPLVCSNFNLYVNNNMRGV